MLGSSVILSHSNFLTLIIYSLSALLECVPTEPRDNVPYLMKDDWFCFPNGLYLVASDDRPPPSLSSFVKCCNGVKSYGLSLTMYFPASINVDALLALQQENEEGGDRAASHNDNGLHQWLRSPAGCNGVFPLWVPVCVCLVCHIPVIHALMDWLRGFQSYLESIEIEREKISSCSTRGTSMVDNHHLQAAIFQLVGYLSFYSENADAFFFSEYNTTTNSLCISLSHIHLFLIFLFCSLPPRHLLQRPNPRSCSV